MRGDPVWEGGMGTDTGGKGEFEDKRYRGKGTCESDDKDAGIGGEFEGVDRGAGGECELEGLEYRGKDVDAGGVCECEGRRYGGTRARAGGDCIFEDFEPETKAGGELDGFEYGGGG